MPANRESLPADDYVDLSRSSVSPYQAAQYAEISKRLNTEVPDGLHTPDVDSEVPPVPPKFEAPTSSPFADPASPPSSPGGGGEGQYANDTRDISSSSSNTTRPMSSDSITAQTLDFPVPPIPAHTISSRYRIDSTPPSLPEINIESRVSVGNYPGLRDNDLVIPGALAVGGGRFPTTPSPLASSFVVPGSPFTPTGEGSFAAGAVGNAPAVPAPVVTAESSKTHTQQTSVEAKRNTAYSLYDPDDAYGGF